MKKIILSISIILIVASCQKKNPMVNSSVSESNSQINTNETAQQSAKGIVYVTATVKSVSPDGKSGTMEVDVTGEMGTFEIVKPNITAILGDKLTARPLGNSGCTITHWQISGPWGPCTSPNENCGYFGVSVNCKNRAE